MSIEVDVWQERGNCLGVNPDIFNGLQPENIVLAKVVCGQCAVRSACLTYAFNNNERTYIWGGLTYEERVQVQQGTRDRDDLSYLFIPQVKQC